MKTEHCKIEGNIIDIHDRSIYPARIFVLNGIIYEIEKMNKRAENYIMPGLIDAHIHIESSMTTPGAFAGAAVSRGTTGVICDPHEIANVLGIDGVKFMIRDAEKVPLKFWFGAPSCVPATAFETAGAIIDYKGVELLLKMREVKYLAEMMNFPGVIYKDSEVHKKIEIAKKYKKPIDGHAPRLTGNELKEYVNAGISTDHECSTLEEALEKISLGMKILIREGSAARNLNSLKDLLRTHPQMIMLCSDDLHPEMLGKRHLNKIIAGLAEEGFDIFDIIRTCTINPANHYDIVAGLLQPGDRADFIIVDDYKKMNVLETWIEGKKVFEKDEVMFNYEGAEAINKFNCDKITKENIRVKGLGTKMRVIEASDGELLTKQITLNIQPGTNLEPDIKSDILKIVVKDRYKNGTPSVGFIKGFGLIKGAFASSVAHDSHNIICIGTNDEDIINAVNEIVLMKGGLAVSAGNDLKSLPLPVAGIMSDKPVPVIAEKYESLSATVKSFGCKMSAPFMTLSFMALLVIPELKLSDKGLFDGKRFCHIPLFFD
jgi:adenine deaminase